MLLHLKRAGPIAGLFFSLVSSLSLQESANATTFGPITVYQQAQNSQYYVHGRIVGSSWVKMAPYVDRPYTYWRLQVLEQQLGDPLPSEIEIRQPGGEIGDTGYQMAGTAVFAAGEDTFIALHDTDEASGVKEVVGLASGKFKVQTLNGQQVVVSGLGLPVMGAAGYLTPGEFSSLLKRIAKGEVTEADKKIWVSRRPTHEADEDPTQEERARQILHVPAPSTPAAVSPDSAPPVSGEKQLTPNSPSLQANSVQESPPKADETSTGFSSWGWLIALGVLTAITFGLYLALRR
jgi:hypothetical protein